MYKTWTYITDPIGNNEFHYNERIALWSEGESPASLGKIFITNIIQGNLDDLEEWPEIVFEEIENEQLKRCTWLKHFLQIEYKGIPTYIFDNHNHALFFRYRYTKQFENTKPFVVIHIDQHADTKENKNSFNAAHASPQEVWNFTNYGCNVGNFLTSAKDAWIIEEIIQVRSQYALHNIEALDFHTYNYILDIDVDFREQKSEEEVKHDSKIINKIIDNVCLITIATSPYFMNQKKAIEIIRIIL